MRRDAATILLFGSAIAIAIALFIALSGGMTLQTPPLTLQDPSRPLVAGLALLAVAWFLAGPHFAALTQPYLGSRERLPGRIAALASVCTLVFATAWTSRAAGGSDSSCYVLQAEAFAHGHATLANSVAAALPGAPNAVFAPVGFLPSARDYGRAAPICAPGLALAMAGAYLVHPSAVFLVVPVAAACLVWLTFLFGRQLDDDVTGAAAAVLLACSPIVLYQAVQPMSDVPAAAAWMAALVSASPVTSGVWASIAVLIRPNLALLVVPLAFLKKGTVPFSTGGKRGQSPFFRSKLGWAVFLGAGIPGVALLLALNAARYGGVFTSGYGEAETLFSLAHVGPNLARYPRWILETQTPFVLLAIAAPWTLRRHPPRARLAWIALASVALLASTYLAYIVFDDWWYIRFLLPALPMVLALAVAALRSFLRRLPARVASAVLAVIVAATSLWGLHVARDRRVTDLQRLESRFALTGDYAARRLPPDAVVLAVQQSGSVRFHGGRDTITWDAIAGDGLDRTIAALQGQRRAVYLALEETEEPRFRLRFAGQRFGALEWPPCATVGVLVRARVYDVEQRARYLRGERIDTELVR